MGLGGISIWQLLIVLAILVLLFGTTRLRSLGGDLGTAIKGFKDSMKDDDKKIDDNPESETQDANFKAESKEHKD